MINSHSAIYLLDKIKKILQTINIEFFLCEGTLLGKIRDNKFLDSDTDIDIGIFYRNETETNKILDVLKQYFSIKYIWRIPNLGITEITLDTNIKIDIFFYFQDQNRIYNICYKKFNDNLYLSNKYYYDTFSLNKILFFGHLFNIPNDPHKYLESKYGDWLNKKIEWDWFNGPLNRIKYKIFDEKNILITH